jgi:agmatine/peptidylarginine deiminase
MFQKHIDHIDEKLEKGIIELAWTSEDSEEFHEEAVDEVSHMSELYNTATSNLKVIKHKIELLKKPALFAEN